MKKQLLILSALILVLSAQQALAHVPSSVPGISIVNTHLVDGQTILRGSEPRKKVPELKAWGVTDVIIFKSQTKAEVDNELIALKELGIRSHHIPFRWKGLESPEVACRQVVQALKILKENRADSRVSFFHCTVGEDRTGLLAGIWRMLDDGATLDEAWKNEMCPNGYADGNYKKPKLVADAIHAELTPLFYAMAAKVKSGDLSLETLDAEVCAGLKPKMVKRTCR